MKKKKKLVIYDNNGNPANEYPMPRLVDPSNENKWAVRLFGSFRNRAKDKGRADSWDIKSEEE